MDIPMPEARRGRAAGARGAVLAACIILGWLGLWWALAPAPGPFGTFDQALYLGRAYDLVHLGRFTNAFEWGPPVADLARPSGMKLTPLYPAFLAGAALLDPGFRRSLDCYVERSGAASCPHEARLARSAQLVLMSGVFLLLWRLAARASGSRRAGWLALGIGLLTAPYMARYIDSLMTETFSLFFATAATAAAVEACRSSRPARWLALSGGLIGLAALTHPEYLYLLLGATLAGAGVAAWRSGWRRGFALVGAFALGGIVVIAPWIARNVIVLSRFALTSGYASQVLAQRVAFDLMSWHDYALSYVCWLPDGTGMGRVLFGPGTCAPFHFAPGPRSFYWIGNTSFMQQTIAAAGGVNHQLRYLLLHYVLADPLWHILVSVPFALNGLWIDHYWGMVLAVFCVALTAGALRRGEDALLVVTLPAWVMLAFHAAVAINQVRYNLLLIIPFSLAGGMALDRAWTRRALAGGSRPHPTVAVRDDRTETTSGP